MSKLGRGAAKAETMVVAAESALERTQKALAAAERVDLAAASAKRSSRKFVRFLLLLTIVGIAVVVIRKVLAGEQAPAPAPRIVPTPTTATRTATATATAPGGTTAPASARNGDQPDALPAEAEAVGEDPSA